jgi:hypothetical protein
MKFWYRINDGAMQEFVTSDAFIDTEIAANCVLSAFNSTVPKYTTLAPGCTISIYFDKESHVSGRHSVAELFGYVPKSELEDAVASKTSRTEAATAKKSKWVRVGNKIIPRASVVGAEFRDGMFGYALYIQTIEYNNSNSRLFSSATEDKIADLEGIEEVTIDFFKNDA